MGTRNGKGARRRKKPVALQGSADLGHDEIANRKIAETDQGPSLSGQGPGADQPAEESELVRQKNLIDLGNQADAAEAANDPAAAAPAEIEPPPAPVADEGFAMILAEGIQNGGNLACSAYDVTEITDDQAKMAGMKIALGVAYLGEDVKIPPWAMAIMCFVSAAGGLAIPRLRELSDRKKALARGEGGKAVAT